MKQILFFMLIITLFVTACNKKKETRVNPLTEQTADASTDVFLKKQNSHLSSATLKELSLARKATAKFHDIVVAKKAGYVDIHLPLPHMGQHYMNPALLDGEFDPANPEILVYQENESTGKFKLVAVEYAFDNGDYINPPEGFTGNSDNWSLFTPQGPWTCHAWVWANNPTGIFMPFNPNVP